MLLTNVNPLPPCPSAIRKPSGKARGVVVALLAGALALMAGCATEPGAAPAADTTKYTLENTDHFVLQDRAALHAVSCTGLMEVPLADGRLEIVANIKNREAQPLKVQASCVFKDATGLTMVEESPWQAVTLPENKTVAVRFTAANLTARKYTVRIRDAR